jgi:hypothetical protein
LGAGQAGLPLRETIGTGNREATTKKEDDSVESGLIKTLRVLAKKRHTSFEWDEILESSGAEADKTALALDYLAKKELIQSTPEGGHWKLTDRALTVVDAMLSIDRGAKRRRSSAGLRVALSSRPLDMKTFMEKVKEEGFSRRDGLRFLSRERRRGYLKEARLLFVGSQKDEIESSRFSGRLRFIEPHAFKAFKDTWRKKGIGFVEEIFLVGRYPPAVIRRAQGRVENNRFTQDPDKDRIWALAQELRKRILSEPENRLYGVCC